MAVYTHGVRMARVQFPAARQNMLQKVLSKVGNPSVCTAAIFVRNGGVLLGLRNYTPEKWKDISVWTTPGGRCDDGEIIEKALRREVAEEVNIKDLEIVEFMGEVPGVKEGDVVLVFYCESVEEPKMMEPEKFSEWRWVPISEYLQGAPYDVMNPAGYRLISEYLKSRNFF